MSTERLYRLARKIVLLKERKYCHRHNSPVIRVAEVDRVILRYTVGILGKLAADILLVIGFRLLYTLVVIVGIGDFMVDFKQLTAREHCYDLSGVFGVALVDNLERTPEIVLTRS